ncbi:hypothetical protein GCM10028773_28410 [Spirosoma koreense]
MNNLGQTQTIDIYIDGVKTYSGISANVDRPDVANYFNNPAARYHGFSYAFPADAPWKNGQNHTISVRMCGVNNDMPGSPRTAIGCTGGTTPNPPTSGCGIGSGLTGYYSNGTIFANAPLTVRKDAMINFSWGGSPMPGSINDDNFNVFWAGQIEAPVSGNYTFKTNNDDGTRLFINGQLIIDDWNSHGPIWQQGSIYSTAGQRCRIELFFYDNTAGAQAQLYWEYPGQATQLVPTCRLYPTTENANARPAFDVTYGCTIERYQLGCTVIEICNDRVLRMYKESSCSNLENTPPSGNDDDGDPVSPYPYNPSGNTPPRLDGGTPPNYNQSSYDLRLIQFYQRARYWDVIFSDDEKALLAVNQELGESVMVYTDHFQQKAPIDVLLFRNQLNISGYSELSQPPFDYNPGLPILTGMSYVFKVSREMAVLRIQNPGWSDYKCLLIACKNVSSNTVHFIFDVAGMVPGAGDVVNAINGGIYILKGNATDAALSFGAMLPIGGQLSTISKWGRNILKYDGGRNWVSKSGLVFTMENKGNRLSHIFDHMKDDLTKPDHGVFYGDAKQVLSVVDEAWEKINVQGIQGVPDPSGSGFINYVVDMGREIGKVGGKNNIGNNQTTSTILIKIKPGTISNLNTAYPFIVK